MVMRIGPIANHPLNAPVQSDARIDNPAKQTASTPKAALSGSTDLSYTVQRGGQGMTVSVINRLSGQVLRQLEFRSAEVLEFRHPDRVGKILDLET
jgi:hypothetical protein